MQRSIPRLVSRALMLAAVILLTVATPAHHAAADSAPLRPRAASMAAEKSALVDLNSAAQADLVKLPGVGEAIADKIIAGRPWKSKYDLVVKKVVTRSAYDKFAKLVVARQASGTTGRDSL